MNHSLNLQSDLIKDEIRIVMGFEVDYNPEIPNKDFNNGGTWGKIINKGIPVLTIPFNHNNGENNFGKSDYEIKYSWMLKQMEILQQLPVNLLEYFSEQNFWVMPSEKMFS